MVGVVLQWVDVMQKMWMLTECNREDEGEGEGEDSGGLRL